MQSSELSEFSVVQFFIALDGSAPSNPLERLVLVRWYHVFTPEHLVVRAALHQKYDKAIS
eukprot:scaffold237250_cov15-Prasinocladus_malaysianus.AAC.1